ncbi:hypothetical protein NAC44_04920 [Allorhizobium sp. BGMRC 0089]|uniref:hypothetical protein n=1 Tax=Allorhizobium sonneratiae TaxID=2934936 RepID=UPI002033E03C|nr:hypothetical protein [Allorhizobium sonneratiae]MCM2291669.1 hypothetical protein [Allorhizobium sonneratiae]
MMDSAVRITDTASSFSGPERTLRLGAAHEDSQSFGLLFATARGERQTETPPPLDAEMIAAAQEDQAELPQQEEETHPPATWLDAMPADRQDTSGASPVSTFNADDNGLYRMFLAVDA